MSRHTPNDALLEDIHSRVKILDKGSPFIHIIEESMTRVRSGFEWGDPALADKYMTEHVAMLGQLRRIFHPLIGKRLSISSQLGLWDGKEWTGHMADWGPHAVRGCLVSVDGVMIKDSYSSIGTSKNFQYCLLMAGPDLEVFAEEPGIDLSKYRLKQGVLVPINGLGGGWWQKINRIVETS